VAGEAASRSIGSKIKFVVGESWMISPLMRQSFLLSSRTVFMFSIQIASTGPSKINHFLSSVCSDHIYQSIKHKHAYRRYEMKLVRLVRLWHHTPGVVNATDDDYWQQVQTVALCWQQLITHGECRTFSPSDISPSDNFPPNLWHSPSAVKMKIWKLLLTHTFDPNCPTTRGPDSNRPMTWGPDPNSNSNPNRPTKRGIIWKQALTRIPDPN